MTRNSGPRLAAWLTLALEFADEIVIMVDETSTDDTLRIARRYADKVYAFEHGANSDSAIDWCYRQATGDWIVRLDDDEFLSKAFTANAGALAADGYFSHYRIPIRWVIREGGAYRWLTEFPWRPQAALRMIRNIGGSFHHPGGTHQPAQIAGEGRTLSADEGVMYHLDLAWRTRAEREQKVFGRYAAMAADSGARMYIYEDEASAQRHRPVPDGELERVANESARTRAAQRGAREAGYYRREPANISLARLLLSAAPWQVDPPVFSAQYLSCGMPEPLYADTGYAAEITIKNTSAAHWPGPGGGVRLSLGSHWRSPSGDMLTWDGVRTFVPGPVRAGDTLKMDAALITPAQPGTYLIEWDLVLEDVAWFSHRDVAGLSVEVEVAPRPGATEAPPAA